MQKILQTIINTFGECEIESRGIWMPLNEDYINNKWDVKLEGKSKWIHDLSQGKQGEKWVDSLLDDSTIEVKREMYNPDGKEPWKQWYQTKNIAVEIKRRKRDGSIELTGLSVTEAITWVHLLSYKDEIRTGFVFEVSELKKLVKKLHKEHFRKKDEKICNACNHGCKGVGIGWGGDEGRTQNIIIPIHLLYMY